MKVLADSRITGKFQVTIPKSVREILGLENGDLLVFVIDGGQISLRKGKLEIEKSRSLVAGLRG